ncbi:hypothetical protein LTR10_015716 [Elasticomyces elasticus]|nr:hypothetical protein LTR10_015716 [Elasticomyces elasticus]KAK4975452.1 hypothetical protein LTR42_004663 [Elasticomyces elasticus]
MCSRALARLSPRDCVNAFPFTLLTLHNSIVNNTRRALALAMASVGQSLEDSGIDLSFDRPLGDAPSSSAPVPASGAFDLTSSTLEQYRFPWGKHKGKLLSEVTPEYLQWLTTECDAYNQNQRMQGAVQSFLASSSQSSLAHPGASGVELPPISSQDQATPTPYTLTFGKYAGERVDEVPSYYVSWLKNSCVAYRTNSRLKDAVDTALASMPTPSRPTVSPQLVRTPSQTFASSQPTSQTPSGSQPTRRPLQPISGLHSTQAVATSLELNATPLQPFTPSQARDLPMASQENQDPNEYVLRFGKHAGKRLGEVPPDYIAWLKKGDYIKNNANLAAAVEHFEPKLEAVVIPPESMEHLPRAATDQDPLAYVLNLGKHAGKGLEEVPPEYVAWLKKGELIKNNDMLAAAVAAWDQTPRVYRLCFGKYEGYTLDEVPPTYLNWLQDFDAPVGHEDLKQALEEHKEANSALQVSRVIGNDKTRKKKTFDLPPETTTDFRRYYYNGDPKGGQMWIGCQDCVRYFGADAKAMVAAGLRPHYKNQRFWLHQVFAYAKHFGTTKHETPTKALNKFKAENYHGSDYVGAPSKGRNASTVSRRRR